MVSDASRLLKAHEVCEKLGISKATLYRMIRKDQFPQPLKLGASASRWHSQEVEDFMAGLPRGLGTIGAEPGTINPAGVN